MAPLSCQKRLGSWKSSFFWSLPKCIVRQKLYSILSSFQKMVHGVSDTSTVKISLLQASSSNITNSNCDPILLSILLLYLFYVPIVCIILSLHPFSYPFQSILRLAPEIFLFINFWLPAESLKRVPIHEFHISSLPGCFGKWSKTETSSYTTKSQNVYQASLTLSPWRALICPQNWPKRDYYNLHRLIFQP